MNIEEIPARHVEPVKSKAFTEAPRPRIPVLDWPLHIGKDARAEGPYSTALGDGTVATNGGVQIGTQLFLKDGDLEGVPPEFYDDYLAMFKSEEMQLWCKRRKQHMSPHSYEMMVKWLNRFLGETVFG